MSEFSVLTGGVAAASTRLGTISGGVQELHGRLGTFSGAAAGTPADGAVEGLLARWAATLPQFALAGERLSGAVSNAAEGYSVTDQAVAGASDRAGAGGA